MLFNSEGHFYCPLCKSFFPSSDYLNNVFIENKKANWISQMTCHYRHNHIRYYNKWVWYHSYFRDYETFKIDVNNRAKRNILRKCKKFLREHKFTVKDFEALQHTDTKTLELARKVLGEGSFLPKKTNTVTSDSFLD